MGVEGIFPHIVFEIGGIPIRDTVLQTWIVVVVLVGLSIWAQNKFRTWEPRNWQVAIEWVVEYIEDMVQDVGGRSLPNAIPYFVTMISFVCIANLLGLLPMFQAPTRDLNTTLALSLVSLGSTYYFAIRKRGVLGWLKSFAEPVFIMLPLNIISQLSRVLSMALRLFGNVIAGEMIGGVIFILLPPLAPLPFNLLGMLTSVLQALVFTVLTFVFVIDAMGSQEEAAIAGQEAAQQAAEV